MALPDALPYFPRPELLERSIRLLLSGSNVTLFAPRRQGKTLFVRHELLPAAHEAGWFAARVDLWRNRADPALGLVEGLESIAHATAKTKRGVLGTPMTLKKVRTQLHSPGVEIEGEWTPAVGLPQPTASLENRLADALHLIVNRADHTLLALDEFQALATPGLDNFVAAFRTVLQDLEGSLSVFFTGSSRIGLNRLFVRAGAPLLRSATSVALDELGPKFVDSRADYLAEIAGLEVDRDQLKVLFETRLFRTPQFLNELVRIMLSTGETDVPRAFAAWVEKLRVEEYAEVLSELQDLDLGLVCWLAMSGSKSVYSIEARQGMANFLGVAKPPTTGKIQSAVRRLTNRHVVEPISEGSYELADQGLQILLNEISGEKGWNFDPPASGDGQ